MAHPGFDALHAAMRAQVDQRFLPGVATALLRGCEVVDRFCHGFADREAGIALREDHIRRIFSSTKLVTSEVAGEVGWGGLAGTLWWINPRLGIAAVLMTQRWFGFGNPYAFVFKLQAYRALGF